MILPQPGARYDQRLEATRNRELQQADNRNLKTDRDSYMDGGRIILLAPDGGRWALVVSNSGILSTVAV
jgi:hypothetical protein